MVCEMAAVIEIIGVGRRPTPKLALGTVRKCWATRMFIIVATPPTPPKSAAKFGRPRRFVPPICFADLLGFCDFADSFCRLVGASGILGHLIWRYQPKICIMYFGTLDITFSFDIGSSDWHHEVFLLPTERCISGPLGFIVPQ